MAYPALTGGTRSAHGRAASSWPARRNRLDSSPYRAVRSDPIGSPLGVHQSGTDIAGLPVMFAIGFQGLNEQSNRQYSTAPPCDWLSTPSGSGERARVGVSHAS